MQSFLNKQHWLPVGFSPVLCLTPSSSAGKGVQRNWAPGICDFCAPTVSQNQGVLWGFGFYFGLGFFFLTKWLLILRAPSPLWRAGQVFASSVSLGQNKRGQESHLWHVTTGGKHGEIMFGRRQNWGQQIFFRVKYKSQKFSWVVAFCFIFQSCSFFVWTRPKLIFRLPFSYWKYPGSEDEWVTDGDREMISLKK